jgi:alpha-tubulin suppressor-like RCC1 family protein
MSYAIRGDYTVFSWGIRLWTSSFLTIVDTTPVPVPGLSYAEQISVGDEHALARDIAGDVWFWGQGMRGDVSSTRLYATPVQVPFPGAPAFTDIAVGVFHSLGLQSDGTVWAWGRNLEGQLGINLFGSQLTPASVPLPAGRRASGIAAGMRWSLARLR